MRLFSEIWFCLDYYLIYVPSCWISDIKWFFRNLKRFWKTLWNFRNFDYAYVIDLFIVGLRALKEGLIHEEDNKRKLKQKKISELIVLLHELNNEGDEWFNRPEHESIEAFQEKLLKVEEKRAQKIWKILKGQKNIDYNTDKYDGSGLKTWWD